MLTLLATANPPAWQLSGKFPGASFLQFLPPCQIGDIVLFHPPLDPFARWSVQLGVWKQGWPMRWRRRRRQVRPRREGGLPPPTWFHLICHDYSLDRLPPESVVRPFLACVQFGITRRSNGKVWWVATWRFSLPALFFCDANIWTWKAMQIYSFFVMQI